MSDEEFIAENPQEIGVCEKEKCRNNPAGIVEIGQPFDMWVERWGPPGQRHRRTVVIHRECNDRGDHTKDWV